VSTFNAHITIVNKTNSTFTFNANQSSGVNTGDWPMQLSPNTTYGPFSQGFDFQIKFTAAFAAQGSAQPPTVSLYMYGDGVQVFDTAINQSPSSPPPFPGSFANSQNPTSATFTIAS
jgi:hypothetical protein